MSIYMHTHALTCTLAHTWTCGLCEQHQSFQGLTLLCKSSTLLLSFLLLLVCDLWPFTAYLHRSQKVSVRWSERVPDSSVHPLLLEATEEWDGLGTSCEGDFAGFILVLPSKALGLMALGMLDNCFITDPCLQCMYEFGIFKGVLSFHLPLILQPSIDL